MLVSALYCPCNERGNPLDHYESGACPSPPLPLPWIASLLDAQLRDERHRDNNITATRLLTCPRQVAIEDNIPSMLDLRQTNTPHVGTVIHREMAFQQSAENANVRVSGQLFGVQITGEMDVVLRNKEGKVEAIEDYKFHGEVSQGFKFSAAVDPEGAAQLNIYRMLGEQCRDDFAVKRMGLWHGAIVSARSKAPAWFYRPVPMLTEQNIANIKPNGAAYTVAQIVEQYAAFHRGLHALPEGLEGAEREQAVRALIKTMPLVGREMWRGSKCTTYCVVRRTCDAIEGITTL